MASMIRQHPDCRHRTVRGVQLSCSNQLIILWTWVNNGKDTWFRVNVIVYAALWISVWNEKYANGDSIQQRVNLLSYCLKILWILFSKYTQAKSTVSNSHEFLPFLNCVLLFDTFCTFCGIYAFNEWTKALCIFLFLSYSLDQILRAVTPFHIM